MIRARENPIAIQAGVLALLMHGLFLFLLIFSFSWKHVQPPAAAEVELWDSLPVHKIVTPPPEVKPEPPPPEIKPEIKPEPKPEPPPAPKAEIQVKPKPVEVKKPPKVEPKKPDPAIKKQEEEKKRKDELDKLKKAMLQDVPDQETPPTPPVDNKAQAAQTAADAKRAQEILAASSGVVNDYLGRITAKIQSHVNNALCGTGKPSLTIAIALLPDGHLNGTPQLVKGSGLPACDLEVEHAIFLAQPLPLPPQRELFDQFRNLNLTFRPNGK
jgi:colicin import membrane protein